MSKDDWDIIIKLAVALIAVWTLFYKRSEILGLLHKDYTSKLDSTIRFFDDFFKNNHENKLTLDRAAQELARLDFVDYDLVVYLIKLHEARLISFDELIRLYKYGHKLLNYKSQSDVDAMCFQLKIKNGRSVKIQNRIWGTQYVFFAFLFVFPLMYVDFIINLIFKADYPFYIYLFSGTYFLGTLILAVGALFQSTNLQDAETFLKKLKEADCKYTEHEKERKLDHQAPINETIWNIREYKRHSL